MKNTIPLKKKYGFVTVLSEIRQNQKIPCRCDCGTEWMVFPHSLRRGDTTSCGCLRAQNSDLAADPVKGVRSHPLYKTWSYMKERCYSPNAHAYERYGGRGIRVCDRWMVTDRAASGFRAFLDDMGPRPDGATIERINNDGPYGPDNCRWATRKEQSRNREITEFHEFQGKMRSLPEIAEIVGLPYYLLWQRVNRGWTVEKAASKPSQRKKN